MTNQEQGRKANHCVRGIPYRGTLQERAKEACRMIGEMCSQGRHPRMTIPAGSAVHRGGDEDMFIIDLIDDFKTRVEELESVKPENPQTNAMENPFELPGIPAQLEVDDHFPAAFKEICKPLELKPEEKAAREEMLRTGKLTGTFSGAFGSFEMTIHVTQKAEEDGQ